MKLLRLSLIVALASYCVLSSVGPAASTTVERMNVERLTQHGSTIIVGTVTGLSDGVGSNGLPYTEVSVSISQTIQGTAAGTYTFRQFGLLAPRDDGNGRTNLLVSPEGWPTFAVGEEVMLFLFETTALGFQSTVGLFQGKFNLQNGSMINAIDNRGLFTGMTVDPGLLTDAETEMLATERGAVPAHTFVSFVTKAVQNSWFE
ncbi:MAG: hypothetical protein IH969_03960 [Candidatus Krumholzibacteriota bacterium]|nr:hypothetical protein [Candidatus Krumholzibacteriota bacterium]